jgi:aspartyl-tRNA synthetase
MKIDNLSSLKSGDSIEDLYGWIDNVRDHGGLTFIDLRDFFGTIQLVFDKDSGINESLKNEYYISVKGVFQQRDKGLENNKIPLGKFEILVSDLTVVNKSKVLPFQIEDSIETDENIRLKYRYLDLRREQMKINIVTRSKTFKSIRNVMNKLDILEIDTPTLIKSTPEGAKDFLVPSRKSPGNFYALPQSPQMYKQLFMMSGFPNYYQIAKCYRDEDSRKDRQPEFTQLDLEFSDANPTLVKNNIEKIVKHIFSEAYDVKLNTPFPVCSFKEALDKYGTDKPDLRINEVIEDLTDDFQNTDIKFIADSLKNNGVVKGVFVNKLLTRKEIDDLDSTIKEMGAGGLGWFKVENEVSGPLTKFLKDDELSKIKSYKEGTLLFQTGLLEQIAPYMDIIRRTVGTKKTDNIYNFLWIEDFPFFEIEDGVLQPSHHPFTSPMNTDEFKKEPENAIALHYDLVLNGVELGSGSQRINDPEIQTLVLQKWGLSEEDIQNRFGWFIEALSYGTPQHAGFAIGIDRLVAEVLNQNSIRDVIPFPKTQSGQDPLTDAPSVIDTDTLLEYNIELIEDE